MTKENIKIEGKDIKKIAEELIKKNQNTKITEVALEIDIHQDEQDKK